MASSLSRMHWFSFAGVQVTNLDFNLNTPKLVSVSKPASPKMEYWEFNTPKRHGSRYSSNRYEDLNIKVTIGLHGTAQERQSKITNLLKQWIGREDKLIFSDRPNCFYKARFFDSCATKDSGTFTEITINFIASFCMYELYDDLRDYLVNDLTMTVDSIGALVCRATWEGITAYTTKTITNSGNFESQPLIELTGTATLITLEMNNKEFSIANLDGTIFIDSENMNVYKMDGYKKVSVLPQFQGLFPTIAPGENTVYIGGTSLNVDVTIDFKNTYIV